MLAPVILCRHISQRLNNMMNLEANKPTSSGTVRKLSCFTWAIHDVTPIFTALNERYESHRDAVIRRNVFQWSRVRLYLSNLSFSQFMCGLFLAACMSAMTKSITAISAWRIVAKILESIVRINAIVVAHVKAIWFSEKRQCHHAGDSHVAVDTVFSKCDDIVSIFVHEGFPYPSSSPASEQRPDSSTAADHVKTFVARNIFPNFIIHPMTYRISLWGLSI